MNICGPLMMSPTALNITKEWQGRYPLRFDLNRPSTYNFNFFSPLRTLYDASLRLTQFSFYRSSEKWLKKLQMPGRRKPGKRICSGKKVPGT